MANQQNYGKIAQNSPPALDIHSFRTKLILMMSTFQVCGRNHVV